MINSVVSFAQVCILVLILYMVVLINLFHISELILKIDVLYRSASNLTPMINLIPDLGQKRQLQLCIIYFSHLYSNIPTAPAQGFIFHNSHATLELKVCIHTFHNIIFRSTKQLNQEFFRESSRHIFQSDFRNISTTCILLVKYR